jgi:hypothetical protein
MLEDHFARYPLAADGAIRHWLACGPVTSPIEKLEKVVKPAGSPFGRRGRWILNFWAFDPASADLKKRLYRKQPPLDWQPSLRPHLTAPAPGGRQWRYAATGEDNVVDFSRFNFTPTLMQGWLFATLLAPQAMTVDAEIITIGPARLWQDGVLQTHFDAHFSYVAVQRVPLTLNLNEGVNDLFLHGEMFGWREARLALGLRFPQKPPLETLVPLGDLAPESWHTAETGLENLLLTQFAMPEPPGRITLSPDAPAPFHFDARVTVPIPESPWATLLGVDIPEGHAELTLAPGESADLPLAPEVLTAMARLPGENALSLTLRPANGLPLVVQRELWASAEAFSHAPYGDYETRHRELLDHLAAMPYDVLSSMAAVATGRAETISSGAVAVACHFMNQRQDCADFYSIGLLALLDRYADSPALLPEDQAAIEDAFTHFKFWIDEPGLDAMCYFTENHQVLFHVTAYLAGQRWPDRIFDNSGYSGRQQKRRARPRIESWILRRLRGSFSEWDSNAYMALDAFAMLALVEMANSARLREMATALLDKLFFLLACQSFRGAHGSTHGRCYAAGLKSARVENTSPLQRVGWGMGIWNGETRATGLLALARRYRVPTILQQIGADLPDVLVTRARSAARQRPQFDMKAGGWDVRTITRRTPDGMLSAAVDYRPGEMGIQEHLWQATLGPEAVVFTTYPGNSQEHGNARPNFWSGSARLPRVGMADRTVICLYRLEENVGLGFSHAYFPTAMFDEWRIDGGWAFARAGAGYVALWGDGALVLTERGKHAGQELRSSGPGHVWLCHVGSQREDGDFAAFCAGVKMHTPQTDGLSARWMTPEGREIAFAWEGPLTVDGRAEDWSDFPHYANAYTDTPMDADLMTLRLGDAVHTLDLKRGAVLTPDPA